MMDWGPNNSFYKPIWTFVRLLLNCAIYNLIFKDQGFIEQLCGPLAIPPDQDLYSTIVKIQIANFLLPMIIEIAMFLLKVRNRFRKLNQFRFPKYFVIFLFKLFIIFYKTQRKKYYAHVLVIQIIIWICTIFFDCVGSSKLAEAFQIIITDCFQHIFFFYAVTRTFCPNFAIYWFVSNLLVFIISQIEAHFYYYPKSQRMDPVFPAAFYAKQDIYRLMIIVFIYFGLFAIFQSRIYGYGMLVAFLISAFPYIMSLKKLEQKQFKAAMLLLLLVCLSLLGLVLTRTNYPQLFKPFFSKYLANTCGIFDQR